METIAITVYRDAVYEEVAKATDYTVSKQAGADAEARDRILAGDAELDDLSRLWDETAAALNENMKEMLVKATSTKDGKDAYNATLEVSMSFDKTLAESVTAMLKSYFVASMIGQWFKFANKGEAGDYFAQAAELLEAAERLLYSRRKPKRPEQ